MKTPNENDAVAFVEYLVRECDDTRDSRIARTPWEAVYAGFQNADETLGWDASITSHPQHAEWCKLVVDSIRSNCCEAEPDEICIWFKSRGLTY